MDFITVLDATKEMIDKKLDVSRDHSFCVKHMNYRQTSSI